MTQTHVITYPLSNEPSADAIREIWASIPRLWRMQPPFGSYLPNRVLKMLDRLPCLQERSTDVPLFLALMGIHEIQRALPRNHMKSAFKSIYLFDAWEPRFDQIACQMVACRVDLAFFSARQAARHFSRTLPQVISHWVPEAIRVEDYRPYPQALKDIDVLQFGRKFDWYHEQIVDYCEQRQLKYLFEESKGSIIFSSRRNFLSGLGRARVSVCVPSNVTHPARSGSVSTMTMRYLQSMAAKCLIVGILPDDMRDHFDYCPIVEIDFNDPVGQLDEILSNFDRYQPLVESNYAEVIAKHDWKNRMDEIVSVLARVRH